MKDSAYRVQKLLTVLAAGFGLSLATSMAGMEIFSSLLVITVMLALATGAIKSAPWQLHAVRSSLALWLWIVISALIIPGLEFSERLAIAGEGRWALVLAALIVVFQDRDRALLCLKITVGASALVGLYSVIQSFTGFDIKGRIFQDSAINAGGLTVYRARGLFSNSMTYAQALQFPFYLAAGFWLAGRQRALWTTAVFLVGAGLLLSFTRGVWMAATLGSLVAAALVSRRTFVGVFAALGVTAGLGYASSPAIRAKVESAFNSQDSGAQQRLALWRANWRMFLDNPITGVGLGQGSSRVAEYHDSANGPLNFVSHAHNIFIEYLSTTGLPGLALFLWFLISIALDWRRARKMSGGRDSTEAAYQLAIPAALVGLMLSGLTEANFNDGEVNHAFLFVVALTLAPLALKPKDHGTL
jgi:O-antigen ligase